MPLSFGVCVDRNLSLILLSADFHKATFSRSKLRLTKSCKLVSFACTKHLESCSATPQSGMSLRELQQPQTTSPQRFCHNHYNSSRCCFEQWNPHARAPTTKSLGSTLFRIRTVLLIFSRSLSAVAVKVYFWLMQRLRRL